MATPQAPTSDILRRLNISTPLTPAEYAEIEHGDDENDLGLLSPATSMTPEPRIVSKNGDVESGEFAHMRHEVKRRDLIIESLKRQHAIKVTDQDTRIRELEHQKHLAELQLEHEVRRFEGKLAQVEDRTRDEMRQLRRKQQQLEEQNPLIRERLNEAKEELREHLVVSESRYVGLKVKAEADLSLQEFVQVLIFEHETQHAKAQERLSRELDGKKGALTDAQVALETTKRDAERAARVHEETIRQLRVDLEIAEERATRHETDARTTRQSVVDLTSKGELYDTTRAQYDELEKRIAALQASCDESGRRLRQMTTENESLTARVAELSRSNDVFEREKVHLQQQLDVSRDSLGRERAEKEAMSTRLGEMGASRESLYQQLISAGDVQKAGFDERLRAEVAKLQQETRQDLAKIQSDAREVFARENAALREARDAAITEVDRLRGRAEEEEGQKGDALKELRQLQTSTDARISELLGQLRIKSFECERLKVGRDESAAAHKAASLEAESLRKKVDVLKQEYYSLQSTTSGKIAGLEAAVGVANEKLKQYEGLEAELDNALLLAGDVSAGSGIGIEDRLGAAIPTSSARRMQQTVMLSRRVVELGKEKNVVEHECAELHDRCGALDKELNEARGLLAQTKQPYSYFIETITEKEAVADGLRIKLAARDARVKELEDERVVMIADLRRLTVVRDGLDSLRSTVHGMGMTAGGKGAEKDKDKEKDKKAAGAGGAGRASRFAQAAQGVARKSSISHVSGRPRSASTSSREVITFTR